MRSQLNAISLWSCTMSLPLLPLCDQRLCQPVATSPFSPDSFIPHSHSSSPHTPSCLLCTAPASYQTLKKRGGESRGVLFLRGSLSSPDMCGPVVLPRFTQCTCQPVTAAHVQPADVSPLSWTSSKCAVVQSIPLTRTLPASLHGSLHS